jgi:phage portal protein BeeE
VNQPALNLSPDAQFRLISGRLVTYLNNNRTYLDKGYDINDIVYAIINLIMDKCRVAPWGIYKIEDEQAYKRYCALMSKKDLSTQDFVDLKKYQRKALTPVKDAGKWGELIQYPNEFDDFQTLITNGIGYDCILGNNYILGRVLPGGANAGIPNDFWLLPAHRTNIWTTDTFPAKIIKYTVDGWGNKEYLPSEILHQRTFNPGWDVNGVQHYGVAPLRAALRLLQRNNSSLTATASAFDNEGVKGILYMQNQVGNVDGDLIKPEIDALADTLRTEWTGAKNRGRIGLGGYSMGWLPIGLNSEEMQVIESEKWDLRRLCSVWGVPSQLLNDDQRAYNNFKEANEHLTSRCCIPRLFKQRNTWQRKAVTEWGLPKNWVLDFDMTVYSELQADVSKTVEWYYRQAIIIPNEGRELANLSAIDDPRYNEPWQQSMGEWGPVSERDANEVDNALNTPDDEDEDTRENDI